jgi:hypothetical protein
MIIGLSGRSQGFAAGNNFELATTVLGPAILVVTIRQRTLATKAQGLNAVIANATRGQVALHARGSALTERKIVLVRATLVGVPRDSEPHTRIREHDREFGVEHGALIRTDFVSVVREIDAFEERHAGGLGSATLISGHRTGACDG